MALVVDATKLQIDLRYNRHPIGKIMKIIVYGSLHGTAKKYAVELGKRLNIDVACFEDVQNINAYKTIVYVGALYAGGVLGMKKTFAKLSSCTGKKIFIATVGLADPLDPENVQNIEQGMSRQLPKDVFEAASLFHLRGGIDYSKLGLKHKVMMALLVKKAKGLPEEKKNAEVQAMIETYNQVVDFVDLESLGEIVNAVHS